MRLSLQALEPRDCPSVFDAGNGVMHFGTGREVQPFSDYTGLLGSLTRVDGTTIVVPSQFETDRPGGPRVAEFDQNGDRTKPDYWAGDPSSRAGVILVDTGGTVTQASLSPPPPPPAATFAVPDLTYGNPGDPNTWVIDVDFQNPASPEWVEAVMDEDWRVVSALGNVALVTRRPNDYPGNYGTVVVGMDLSFAGAQGETTVRWDQPHPNWLSDGVYVDCRDINPGFPVDPSEVGEIMAHEEGHGLGLEHSTELPWNIMTFGHVDPGEVYTPDDVIAARAGAAKAVALEYHPDPAAVSTAGP